jgi:hypothetical protein
MSARLSSTLRIAPGPWPGRRQVADAGVNIELAYTTFAGRVRLVLAVDDFEKARAAV